MTNQEQELVLDFFEKNDVKIEDSVVVTENSVIVTVSATLDHDFNFHKSDYFIKELKKSIPALREIIIKDKPISVIMEVPMHGQRRNNTIDTIQELAKMAICIIDLIIDNMSIKPRMEAIGKDCKPWYKKEDEQKAPCSKNVYENLPFDEKELH